MDKGVFRRHIKFVFISIPTIKHLMIHTIITQRVPTSGL